MLLGGCSPDSSNKSADKTSGPDNDSTTAGKTSHRVLNDRQFATVSAACERILPKDQDAGALEANVPEFIDRQLETPELETLKPVLIGGLNLLERRARGFAKTSYAEATPAQQDELLRDFRDSAPGSGEARFYELLMVMTLEGFLGDPSYGGNKDRVGWKLVGFNASGPFHNHHSGH